MRDEGPDYVGRLDFILSQRSSWWRVFDNYGHLEVIQELLSARCVPAILPASNSPWGAWDLFVYFQCLFNNLKKLEK